MRASAATAGSALLEGTVGGIDGTPSFAGTVRAQGADLGAMLAALDLELAAVPAAPLANAFSAKGTLSADANGIAVRDIQLRLGESQAGGTASWRDGDVPQLDAKLALNRIDLDQYLPADGGGGRRERAQRRRRPTRNRRLTRRPWISSVPCPRTSGR